MDKLERQKLIGKIISEKTITKQSQLRMVLKEYGVDVNQSTLSRDIREMQIEKYKNENNVRVYYQPTRQERLEHSIKSFDSDILEVTQVEFLIVLKTTPYKASVVSAKIDQMGLKGLVATLAGYDTVVLIGQDKESAKKLKEFVETKTL